MPGSARVYAERDTEFLGLTTTHGWTLKNYAIRYRNAPLDCAKLERAALIAGECLPTPACAENRIGVGFTIAHQGATGDYFVTAWWDNENELALRVFVSKGGEAWRPAQGSESVCVWDLAVIWAERQAYVTTVLSGAWERGRANYLAARM